MPRAATLPAADPADGDTERRILAAAHTVFSRRGTAGARMQEIAAEAGVNHALLHYYFRTKEHLAEVVFLQCAASFFPPLMQLFASPLPLDTKVERVVEHLISSLRRTPFLPGYILAEVTHHPERAASMVARMGGTGESSPRALGLQRLRADIAAAVDAGTIRPIPPEDFIVSLMSLCVFPFAARPMMQAMLELDDEAFGALIEHRRTTLAAFFLAGLRP